MMEGMQAPAVQAYLEKFAPLKQLPKGPTMSEEAAIRWLIDEAFRASKLMIRTHHKEDIIRFIVLAQVLNQHGYQLQWMKFKGCIGATKVGVVEIDATMTNVPKEVARHAEQRANGKLV